MTGMSGYPVLTVTIPALMLWTQHTGGCRCLCGIYHPHTGRTGCDRPEHEGLRIRLDVVEDTGISLPGADEPLPVCRRCYLALSPSTGTARNEATAPHSLLRSRTQHHNTRPGSAETV